MSAATTERCDTTPKQPGGITGRGFVKGDSRINRNGRPRSFDAVRKLAQEIGLEKITDHDGVERTQIESILRRWLKSKNPILQRAFVEYAYGKVPDKLQAEGIGDKTTLILHYAHERKADARELPDDAPAHLTNGEDATAA